jgi:hypothetical protein
MQGARAGGAGQPVLCCSRTGAGPPRPRRRRAGDARPRSRPFPPVRRPAASSQHRPQRVRAPRGVVGPPIRGARRARGRSSACHGPPAPGAGPGHALTFSYAFSVPGASAHGTGGGQVAQCQPAGGRAMPPLLRPEKIPKPMSTAEAGGSSRSAPRVATTGRTRGQAGQESSRRTGARRRLGPGPCGGMLEKKRIAYRTGEPAAGKGKDGRPPRQWGQQAGCS